MTRPLRTLFLAAVALSARSAAADKLSRADVMKRAAQHPTTEAMHSQIDQVRAQKRQADALRWPRISLSLGVVPSLRATLVDGSQVDSVERATDYKIGDVRPGFTGELTIIQPLYTFGKIGQRQRAAELGIRAQTAQARMRQADVAVEGADLYEKYLLARDLARFLDDIDHMLVRSIESTADPLAANATDVTQHDLLRLKTARGPLPAALDAVVLSHAHLDHAGALPVLVDRGYRGPIYTPPATRDLCAPMLDDAASIQLADARHIDRLIARGVELEPVAPLYDLRAPVLGIALGLGAAAMLAAQFHWPFVVRPGVLVLAVGFSALVGAVFGFFPARKAARLDPIQALRFE